MPGRQQSRAARRAGYVISILINAVLLYLLNAHPGWRSIAFLTPATAQVIVLVSVSLAAGIVANCGYFVTDPPRVRAFGDLVTMTIALVASVRVLEVFPFAFHGTVAFMSGLVHVILVVGIIGASIGILYSIVMLIKGQGALGKGSPPPLSQGGH